MLLGRVHVPLALFTATTLVWPPTDTRMVAALSFTVPERDGVRSLVFSEATVTVGAAVSIVSSLAVASALALPA